MHKNEQITNRRSGKAKPVRGRYTVVLLAGAVLFCAAAYLVKTYGQEILTLFVSNERDTEAALLTEREWAQRLEVPGVAN
jgi:hypothetical protein